MEGVAKPERVSSSEGSSGVSVFPLGGEMSAPGRLAAAGCSAGSKANATSSRGGSIYVAGRGTEEQGPKKKLRSWIVILYSY